MQDRNECGVTDSLVSMLVSTVVKRKEVISIEMAPKKKKNLLQQFEGINKFIDAIIYYFVSGGKNFDEIESIIGKYQFVL